MFMYIQGYIWRMPPGEEPVPSWVRQTDQDRPHGPGATEQTAQGKGSVRLGDRRFWTQEHGIHGAPRHLGSWNTVCWVQWFHIGSGEEVRALSSI